MSLNKNMHFLSKSPDKGVYLLGVFAWGVFAWGVFAWVFLRIAWVFLRISADFFYRRFAEITASCVSPIRGGSIR